MVVRGPAAELRLVVYNNFYNDRIGKLWPGYYLDSK